MLEIHESVKLWNKWINEWMNECDALQIPAYEFLADVDGVRVVWLTSCARLWLYDA